MTQRAVNLERDERGVLFSADEEARSLGMAVEDPYPKMLALLERGPVLKGAVHELMDLPPQHMMNWPGRDAYTVLSFDAVNKAFTDSENFTNKVYDDLSLPLLGDTLLNMDGLRHRRMRDVAKPYFKPGFTEGWWNDKWIVQAVDDLFARLTCKDSAELNMELCAPLPVSVVSVGFGMPVADVLPFRRAIHDVIMNKSAQSAAAGAAETERILNHVIAERRKDPADDLISRLIAAEMDEGDGNRRSLADDEILRYCRMIVFAGGGTTWRQMGITIMTLLNNPDQLDALRADRSLLRPTIQESTRWYPTDPVFCRWVARDTVLEGVEMKAGSIAYLCLASANRDRTRWENPDVFDIHRPVQRHFAFGAGIHACLGQHLSRQEMEVALNALLDRMPGLRWNPDMPVARMSGGTLLARGPDTLPVVYGKTA